MYSNVVVGIDGTDGGRDAVAAALKLVPPATRLELVHVRVLEIPALRGTAGVFEAQTREASLELLEVERARLAPTAETLSVLAPNVGTGLHDAAESRGAALLVVGSCHRSAVGRVVSGDDTRAALHRAPCAVAVIPRDYRNRARRPAVIGVAYDGSADGELALAHGRRLAETTGAALKIRSVVTPKIYGALGTSPAIVEDAEGLRAHERERMGHLGNGTVEVAIGTAAEHLAAFSEEVDVLICGSRHNGIVKRVTLGSTSDYLARHCACPLIVTPAAVGAPSASLGREALPTA